MSKRLETFRNPDYSPKVATKLPEKLQRHTESTYNARYVWLPIEWQDDKPVLRWRDEWTLEEVLQK
jgi:hypothetical protein